MPTIIRRAAAALLTGIATAAPILSASAQPLRPVRAPLVDPYAEHIAEASRRFGIPAAWIRAVMRAESADDPRAMSRKGAIGLMQIMPATWAALRIRHRLGPDPYDPRDNILAGAGFLRELHDRYGSAAAMLAAYNAGPGRYEASLSGRPLPAETRAYVAAVAQNIDGGATTVPVMVAAVDPLAWTRAPLFVAQSPHKLAADSVAADRLSSHATGSPSSSDAAPTTASQAGGLFVAQADTGPRR